MKENTSPIPQADYDKMLSLMVRICLDFAVVKDGKVLLTERLIQPCKDKWHFPGGMVRKGQTIKQTADRILQAELGLKPHSLKFIDYIEYMNLENPDNDIAGHDIALFFKATLEDGELKGSFQAKKMQYFAISELPENTVPEVKEVLKKNWEILSK